VSRECARAEQFVIPFVQNCPQPWWAMLHAILPQLLDFFVKRLFASWAEMQRRTQGQACVFIYYNYLSFIYCSRLFIFVYYSIFCLFEIFNYK
jgi:hypothetical protein